MLGGSLESHLENTCHLGTWEENVLRLGVGERNPQQVLSVQYRTRGKVQNPH